MQTDKFLNFDTEGFIFDKDFLKWVLHPDDESDLLWKEFLEKYPEKKKEVEEAIIILKAVQPVEPELNPERLDQIRRDLMSFSHRNRIIPKLLKIAAIFIMIISLGGMMYYLLDDRTRLPFEFASEESLEKGKIVMADGTIREFETQDTRILQISSGEVSVNNETIVKNVGHQKPDVVAMNQVIIPYGQRSEITLTDGTRIWLNSGSQLSYPVEFKGDIREVFLAGEAFFDVTTNPSKPFYVTTNEVKVRVTGTRFNLSSYENDQGVHCVLVSGKVTAGRNKRFAKMIEMTPGERVVYDKVDESILKEEVNVALYSSWVNGYLIFNNEPLSVIFKKLERYYNKRIKMEQGFDNITFSGKLDLSNDLDKVLENISFSTHFIINKEIDTYIIKQRSL